MRILLFSILSVISINSFSQITWQNPLPTGSDLYNVFFLNQQLGWAVGEDGAIIATNASVSSEWWLCNSPVTYDLNEITMTSDGIGFCIGMEGCILKSINWGESWVIINSNTFHDLYDIEIIQADMIWVVGDNGLINYSNDAGETWVFQSLGTDLDLRSICMLNENEGWIAGENYTLFHTIDGGLTWLLEYEGIGYCYNSVCFVDSLTGWAGGMSDLSNPTGSLIKTEDGGQSWTEWDSSPGGIYDIHFFDPLNGWMNKGSSLMTTNDGGKNWTEFPDEWKNAYYFMDELTGWAVADFGTAYQTTDGGVSWILTSSNVTDKSLWTCSFVDDDHGWVAGEEGGIFFTENGGEEWHAQESGVPNTINALSFADQEHGWALAFYRLLRTGNGGQDWEEILSGSENYYDIFFHDSLQGWMTGNFAAILYTDDGGDNWVEQNSGFPFLKTINEVYFLDNNIGWAVGVGGCSRTTDGGKNWIYSEKGVRNIDVFFIDPDHGWMVDFVYSVGSRIWATDNGGVSWQERSWINDCIFHDLHFIDNQTGYAAVSSTLGDDDGIFYTENGGLTWNAIKNSGKILMSLSFPNNLNGWAVGVGGQILKIDHDPVYVSPVISLNMDHDLIIYPVPSASSMNFKLNLTNKSDVSFGLYNFNGQKVIEKFFGNMNKGWQYFAISIDHLPAGIYYTIIEMGNQFKTRKVIIN